MADHSSAAKVSSNKANAASGTEPHASAFDRPWAVAIALALGAAVSLGLARFSYALLLPLMRADLSWSYFTAGAMNTANAVGYLLGALLTARWLQQHDARQLMLWGMAAAAALLAAHAWVSDTALLMVLRTATGVASAASFVGGGLLAARWGAAVATRSDEREASLSMSSQRPIDPTSQSPRLSAGTVTRAVNASGAKASSLVLGLFYGGTGLGIVASAVLVPAVDHAAWTEGLKSLLGWGREAASWRLAWLALAAGAVVATLWAARFTAPATIVSAPTAQAQRQRFDWLVLRFGLAAYLMFGLGYIGYMTFIITLLREQGMGGATITWFYVVLGVGVVVSPWLWAGLLQRHRGGRPIATLNALLATATMLPVVSQHPIAAFASGALFGGVFLQVVAATTAMVRHNTHPAAWTGGIAAFTVVFAAGQIIGPSLVGVLADAGGGLRSGFAVSACLLAAGAGLGLLQRAVPRITPSGTG